MIRDPSDGSVREPKKADIGMPTSGLAPLEKDHTNEAARLKASREWLEDYHKRRGGQNELVRRNHQSELPSTR